MELDHWKSWFGKTLFGKPLWKECEKKRGMLKNDKKEVLSDILGFREGSLPELQIAVFQCISYREHDDFWTFQNL